MAKIAELSLKKSIKIPLCAACSGVSTVMVVYLMDNDCNPSYCIGKTTGTCAALLHSCTKHAPNSGFVGNLVQSSRGLTYTILSLAVQLYWTVNCTLLFLTVYNTGFYTIYTVALACALKFSV